jgi:NAD(P)-dependent dehydrogenase (short-subunit alcohol dehydrogenase family)
MVRASGQSVTSLREYSSRMRYALLTGVGRPGQVGDAVAARFATDGYALLLVDRTADAVEARATDIRSNGGQASAFSADLGSESEVGELFERIGKTTGGRLSAFVHLAGGFSVTGPVADTQLTDWDKQLTINLRTAFLVARGAVPLLRQEKGSAVFFSSESALSGAKVARTAAYAVSKSGVLTLAAAISQEESANGVRVNVVAPAAIRTAANTAGMGPDARFVEREDVAATVAWLCSSEARAVTGQVIRLAPR